LYYVSLEKGKRYQNLQREREYATIKNVGTSHSIRRKKMAIRLILALTSTAVVGYMAHVATVPSNYVYNFELCLGLAGIYGLFSIGLLYSIFQDWRRDPYW
jgi:hypothetical protein